MNKEFLEEFINYSNQVFPTIDSHNRESIKAALEQFDINKFSWFSYDDLGGLCQGDILNKIPFELKSDPFWSEENQERLRISLEHAKQGKLTKHEISEVFDE